MLETLPRRKIRDQVAERLKALIVAERLRPGDRLPTESALAERFGVSRLSLREATKALEFLGIVESKTGVGLTVGHFDLRRMTEHLGFHPALHSASPRQLIDTRVVVETGVLPHVAQRMAADPRIYASLAALVERFRAADGRAEWIELDIAFHRALLDASGLAPLVAFGDLLQIFFQRVRDGMTRSAWQAGIESHRRIIDALRDGDVASASDELRRHIESHRARLEGQP